MGDTRSRASNLVALPICCSSADKSLTFERFPNVHLRDQTRPFLLACRGLQQCPLVPLLTPPFRILDVLTFVLSRPISIVLWATTTIVN